MALNDYRCTCGHIEQDCIEHPTTCPCGEPRYSVYFGLWRTVAYHGSSTTDAQGRRKAFKATEDPLVMANLGLSSDPASAGVRVTSDDQAKEFRERLARDGDSVKLRSDVLEVVKAAKG